MNLAWIRRLALASAVLVLVIITCSAALRLAQSGLGCADWPACYAAAADPEAAPPAAAWQTWVRGAHRVSATLVSLLLIIIALMGWERLGQRAARPHAVLSLVMAGFLAWLGRMTPSTLPAVVLGNLLGGMLMAALLFALWSRLREDAGNAVAAGMRRSTPAMAMALLLLQVALGGLIGARHAALACRGDAGCGSLGSPDWAVFNPFVLTVAEPAALRWLVMVHVVVAVMATAVVAAAALHMLRRDGARRAGRILLVMLAVQIVLGVCAAVVTSPLLAVLAHNLVAALLVSLLGTLAMGTAGGRGGTTAIA